MKDENKTIIIVLMFFILIMNLVFSYSWCYVLEKNQKQLLNILNNYQNENYKKEIEQDKEIRLLKQDLKLIINKEFEK